MYLFRGSHTHECFFFILFEYLKFPYTIVYIIERDVHSYGPLIRMGWFGLEEGSWDKSFSFFFFLLRPYRITGKGPFLAVKLH